MENIICVNLLDQMRNCEQMPGLSVLDHGIMVSEYYFDLIGHLQNGTELKYVWKLPEWASDPKAISHLPSAEIMSAYTIFHDAGKPFCMEIDSEGKKHFPNHAQVSKEIWLTCGGDIEVGELIGMDMDAHLLKADGVPAFAAKPQAKALLLTALAEIHANATLFGGIESTSFKIKWKQLASRGKSVLALLR